MKSNGIRPDRHFLANVMIDTASGMLGMQQGVLESLPIDAWRKEGLDFAGHGDHLQASDFKHLGSGSGLGLGGASHKDLNPEWTYKDYKITKYMNGSMPYRGRYRVRTLSGSQTGFHLILPKDLSAASFNSGPSKSSHKCTNDYTSWWQDSIHPRDVVSQICVLPPKHPAVVLHGSGEEMY
ncbi:hypothetical protein J5N97_011724 [Dioscorea zingiberensis]|uniref:Uncharacterized protein n=1 Tax=Dioscorea zingiberensis TaxID=325984 RepID=A0A9D5D2N5_9LILI|nr:hypothetical protein J5N97_011724 [Dioscorea zingiberensis]